MSVSLLCHFREVQDKSTFGSIPGLLQNQLKIKRLWRVQLLALVTTWPPFGQKQTIHTHRSAGQLRHIEPPLEPAPNELASSQGLWRRDQGIPQSCEEMRILVLNNKTCLNPHGQTPSMLTASNAGNAPQMANKLTVASLAKRPATEQQHQLQLSPASASSPEQICGRIS